MDHDWRRGLDAIQVGRAFAVPFGNAAFRPLIADSAVLQVIATATIAAYIGVGGLGRFLIDGLAAGNYVQTAGGAVLVSALALVVDGVFAVAQRVIVSPGLTGGGPAGSGRWGRPRVRREIVLAPGKPGEASGVVPTTSA